MRCWNRFIKGFGLNNEDFNIRGGILIKYIFNNDNR